MEQKEFSLFVLLTAVFVAALVTANTLAVKIVMVGGMVVPAGVVAYSITFAVTDSVCEIWGRARAQALVRAGFAVLVLVWLLTAMGIALPPAPFWPNQAAFETILATANRVILASLIAYTVSQSFDVWVFSRIKERFHSRHLWLRNNVSTVLSQTIDTCLFITIAFYGQFPILPLILGQLVVKFIIALLDTPLVYLLVHLLRQAAPGDATRPGPA